MFEQTHANDRIYRCPICGLVVHKVFAEKDAYTCPDCNTAFTVMVEPDTGRTAFFAPPARAVPHPLYLPRGSIRALVALGLSGACWLLMLTGREAPGALLSLLLTVIGFYFGFRTRTDTGRDRIFDASVHRAQPLSLPAGLIRSVLFVGFAIAAVVLYSRGQLAAPALAEFFAILFALIVGRLFGKVIAKAQSADLRAMVGHLKGIVVLAAAVLVAILLVSGRGDQSHSLLLIVLCAIISFYFGSRT